MPCTLLTSPPPPPSLRSLPLPLQIFPRIELNAYSKIMGSKLGEAKALMATHLAKTVKEEFADHQYLTKQKEKSKKRLSPEERYDRGEITIEEVRRRGGKGGGGGRK